MPPRPHSSLTARLGCLLAYAIAAAVALEPGTSHADVAPLAVALEYAAPPGCPDVSEFKSIVVGRLGYGAFRDDVPDRALVHVFPHGKSLEGRIEWQDAKGQWQGERAFPSRSGDCVQLVRAMAFALALQIQLLATATSAPEPSPPSTDRVEETAVPPLPPERETIPPPEQAPPPKPRPAPAVPEADEPSKPSRPATYAVGVGGLAGFGISDTVTPFGRAFGQVAWGPLSIELAAEVGPPSTIRREDGAGFSHQVILAALAGCGTLDRWSACVVGKGGQLQIDGEGVDNPASRSGLYAQTGLRLAATQDLGRRFFLRAQAEGLITVTRPQVVLDKMLVWTGERFAGTLGLDLGVRFR